MRKLLTILFLAGISLTTKAQIQINSDFNVAAQRSVDGKQYKVVNNKHVPYADTSDFLATIPRTRRHIGEIAFIYNPSGKINVWQFIGGIEQANLFLVGWNPIAVTTNKAYPVQTIAEMLALPAVVGDVVVVADSSKSYILAVSPATSFENWLELKSPVLGSTDYLSEGNTNLYFTAQRVRDAISGGVGINFNNGTGVITNTFNPIQGNNISITGTFPNKTFAVTGVYSQSQIDSIKTVIQQQIRQEISDSVGNRAVDSITIVSGVVDTLKYWIEGVSYVGGFINRLAAVSDGLITPGYVTWLHDSTFFASSAIYVKNSNYYVSPSDTITVSGIDATYPVKFVFIVDTTGHAGYISGTPSPTPLDPQIDPASQLQLTTGITFNAGATSPSNLIVNIIYDEDLEWATGTVGTISVNFNNTVAPFYGVKNADIASYSKNAQLTFEGATQTVSDQILSLWIYLKVPLGTKNSLSFRYYNGASASSNSLSVVNTFGLNPNLTNTWQQITIPYSAFTWSSQLFNKLTITMANSASNGFKLDRIELQSGLQNIPPQTDYSNKVDSVNLSQGNLYYWTKGVKHFVGAITDTSLINGWIRDSMMVIENSHYTTTEIDNIIDSVRQEIIDAGGGGVISFNGRTGPVVSQLSDYNTFFYPKNVIDSLLELKLDTPYIFDTALVKQIVSDTAALKKNITDSTDVSMLNGGKIDTAHIPIFTTVISHEGAGLQTVYASGSDTIHAKNLQAGTGITLTPNPDSSITISSTGSSGTGGISKIIAGYGQTQVNDSTTNVDTGKIATVYANSLKTDKATTITINGTTQDLSTNRSWTVSGSGSALDKQDSMNIYMPEKYGAVGDGATDDAGAFQAMIDAMPTRGGRVHLMSKTYLIGTTVTVDKTISFDGSGRLATVVKNGNDNVTMFRVIADRVSFKNLQFYSSQPTPTSGCAIRLDSTLGTDPVKGFIISDSYVYGFYNQIEAIKTYSWGIKDCFFGGFSNYSVVISNIGFEDAGDSYITGCTFEPKNNNSVAAIYQTSSGGLRVSNNKFNWNSVGKFKYAYVGFISGTVDLIINGNSFENYTISAIKLNGTSPTYFKNVAITGNQFASYTSGTRPDITIDSVNNISIQGNVFTKASNDTAILLNKVNTTNISNSYDGYEKRVSYTGTNTNLSGDGLGGSFGQMLSFNSSGIAVPTSTIKDSSGVPTFKLRDLFAGALPSNYTTSSLGSSQLSIIGSYPSTGIGDVSMINSAINADGFTFWQQTGPATATRLLRLKSNGNVGFGSISNPIAYVDIPAGTNSTGTGQIHLSPGRAQTKDGYLSYDTLVSGTPHLYFNIGGINYKLDQQVSNKWVARVGTTTSSATPTINTDNYDIYKLTAQTSNITSFTTNLSGTPNDGDILEIQITGTATRAITWGTSFVSSTVSLPTTTIGTATLTVIFQYFTTSSYGANTWVCTNYF